MTYSKEYLFGKVMRSEDGRERYRIEQHPDYQDRIQLLRLRGDTDKVQYELSKTFSMDEMNGYLKHYQIENPDSNTNNAYSIF